METSSNPGGGTASIARENGPAPRLDVIGP